MCCYLQINCLFSVLFGEGYYYGAACNHILILSFFVFYEYKTTNDTALTFIYLPPVISVLYPTTGIIARDVVLHCTLSTTLSVNRSLRYVTIHVSFCLCVSRLGTIT